MAAWNLRFASSWASLLGLVNVPLFGRDRASNAPAGDHAVLLDGQASSVIFSSGDTSALLSTKAASKWSWSSNVNHALIVDQSEPFIYSVQWNNPSDFRKHSVSGPADAARLIAELSTERPQPTDFAIHRVIDIFRSLRFHLADVGGTDSDAVRMLNVLLVLASLNSNSFANMENFLLGDALELLQTSGIQPYAATEFSDNALRFPIIDILQQLLDEHRGYTLDPYLLIRHASGSLFQEANIELDYAPSQQRRLFITLHDKPPAPAGVRKRDARYTPNSLARFLADEAVKRFQQLNPEQTEIEVLDPACGSGIFLIEAARSATGFSHVKLRGFDNDSESVVISQFAVGQSAEANRSEGQNIDISIEEIDSLSASSWGSPDVVLMNPPFLSWGKIDRELREVIKSVLGDLYFGQSDTAIAFLFRAVSALPPGSVLASLAPGPFLESKAAKRLREYLANDPNISVEIIGLFRGFKYFMEAAVEPAFLLISRAPKQSQLSVVIAESGREDLAIRAARLDEESVFADGYEVSQRSSDILSKPDWTPRPMRGIQQVDSWRASGMPTVSNLFDVKLGIRIGDKPVFLVPEKVLRASASSVEQSYFKPVADVIQHGRIIPRDYIFYPYRDGRLTLTTESELRINVPWFYQERLRPKQQSLEARRSRRSRQWWELVEPRPTWMSVAGPRILTPAFGYFGSFAFDIGKYAVVQGNAWFLTMREATREVYLAYLALLNSYEFESLLALLCPQVQGGQYELYRADVRDVPMPNLANADPQLRHSLFEIGERLVAGEGLDPLDASKFVCQAYGTTPDEFSSMFAPGENGAIQFVFDNLMREWRESRSHTSKVSDMTSLPHYREIINLGPRAIPLLLRELRRQPDHLFSALRELTDVQPVQKPDRGRLKAMAAAWINWGLMNKAF